MEQNSSSDLHLDELSVLGIILLDRQNVSSINSAIKIWILLAVTPLP